MLILLENFIMYMNIKKNTESNEYLHIKQPERIKRLKKSKFNFFLSMSIHPEMYR